MQYFNSERINEHITCIHSKSGENLYLFEGDTKALLMDTCVGYPGLRALVDSLTDKPYEVVITHGHVDHAMGSIEFSDKNIYMSHKDYDIHKTMQSVEARYAYAMRSCNYPGMPEVKLDIHEFLPERDPDYLDLCDGQIFDLGGLHIEMIAAPGHTQGSFALLVQEEQVLVMGDAGNVFTFLFDEQFSSTVENYQEMLLQLKKRLAGKYRVVYLCHGAIEAPAALIDGLIELCDDIKRGDTDDLPFDFMGDTEPVIAKAMRFEEGMRRADGKIGNIVYRKSRVFNK